ncbi:NAD-P-binding protein [Mycena maculata]|uniref:NAD-P-binding protein n=1 Tax=Mycena maculata TaxID=230809 RepID=A0AAD7MTB6_9AGAR|nr:NAD-P-binding protein [Mycena maculata]
MPDLSGKVTFNATVYLAARSPDKAAAAIERLRRETNKSAIFIQLDLVDLRSVLKAAEAFLAQEAKLDILFNNGYSSQIDSEFGTNVIGHFFLTELLIPALAKSYEETGVRARIINTSSSGHQFAPGDGMEFVSLQGGPERDAWVKKGGGFRSRWRLYGESKIGNIYISNYFAKKYADVLVSCALHPGGIKTELQRNSGAWMQAVGQALLYPAPMGAYTQLWGATIATPAEITGQYLVPWGKVGKADKRASDTKVQDAVIAYLKEQIKNF